MGSWFQLKIVVTIDIPLKCALSVMDFVVYCGFRQVESQALFIGYFDICCANFQLTALHSKIDITETLVIVASLNLHFFGEVWTQIRTLVVSSTSLRVLSINS